MTAVPDLDADLVDLLAPEGAPSDEDIATATVGDEDGGPGNEAAERVAAWEPDDADAADWVAMKAQKAQAAIDEARKMRERRIAIIERWFERETKRHDRTLQWAEDLLGRWLAREIAADESKRPRKSRDLPSGVRVKVSAGRPRLVVDDRDALVEWLTSNEATHEMVEVEFKVDANKVKALVLDDGIALPGAHVETSSDTYKLEL